MSDRSDRGDTADTDTDAPREPYGVGPAYPSSHTRFTTDTPGAVCRCTRSRAGGAGRACRLPARTRRPPAATDDPYYTPSAEFTVAEGVRDVGHGLRRRAP